MAPKKGKDGKEPKLTRSGRVSARPKKLAESSSDATAPKPKRRSTKSSAVEDPVPPVGKLHFLWFSTFLSSHILIILFALYSFLYN